MSKDPDEQLPSFLYAVWEAERLICKLPPDDTERNTWLIANGISEEAIRLRNERKNI
jgi:hypothetical protein